MATKAKTAASAQKAGKKAPSKSLDATPAVQVAAVKPTRSPDRTESMRIVCDRIAMGESLVSICKSGDVYSYPTIMRWLSEDVQLQEMYARAREAQADYHFDGIVEISDEQEVEARYQGEDIKLDLSATAVARNRLRVDARKWVAAKLAPRKYGDSIAIGGSDALPSIKHDVTLSPDEAYLRLIGK